MLGIESPAGLAACKGTIVHKVLEALALESKARSDGLQTYTDDVFGTVGIDSLSVKEILDVAYNYYKNNNPHLEFTQKDLKDCLNWTKKAIEFKDGIFHPHNRKIIAAEHHFDIKIEEPWAIYDFKINNQRIQGNLAIKGTIDLITEVDQSTLEIIDWKTGAYRTVFPTKQLKDYKTLQKDTQLQIYFWAASQIFTQYDTIIITIYYINAGGPFTLVFHKEQIPAILDKLKNTFTHIKNNTYPQKNVGWWCNICTHKKTGNCNKIYNAVRKDGLDVVTSQFVDYDNLPTYKNPGE